MSEVFHGEPGPVELPFVEVLRGEPDEAELAALVAGLVAARDNGEWGAAPPVSPWSDHGHRLGVRRPGPDAWRWSG